MLFLGMGITNTRGNLERIIASEKGKRDVVEAEIARIEAGIEELQSLLSQRREIEANIAAAELLIRRDHPGWSSESVKAAKKANRHSPVPFGSLGRTALEVLKDAPPEGLRTRAIAIAVLKRFNLDYTDRKLVDAKANSLGQYLKQNDGDLVESDGEPYYKKWRLIRGKQKLQPKRLG